MHPLNPLHPNSEEVTSLMKLHIKHALDQQMLIAQAQSRERFDKRLKGRKPISSAVGVRRRQGRNASSTCTAMQLKSLRARGVQPKALRMRIGGSTVTGPS